MRLLGLDVETTGLDWEKERILEIGISLHEAGDPVYLHQNTWTMYDEEIKKRLPLSEEIVRLTGIKQQAILEFGIHPTTAYNELDSYLVEHRVDYIVAHNGTHFDRPFILYELDRLGIKAPRLREVPWLDTRRDIRYKPGEEPKQRSLEYLLMKKRFIPAIAHRALPDAANVMWLLAHYDINEIIEYAKLPWIVVSPAISYEERDLAKSQGYSWQELDYKIYSKSWVKLIKRDQFEAEARKFPVHELRVLGK